MILAHPWHPPQPIWWLRVGLLALPALGLWAAAMALWARRNGRHFVAGAAVTVASGLALVAIGAHLLGDPHISLWELTPGATRSLLGTLTGLGLALIAFGVAVEWRPRKAARAPVISAGPVRSAALPPTGRRLFVEVFAPPMIAGALFPFAVLAVALVINSMQHGGEAFLAKSFTAIFFAWLLMVAGLGAFFLWGLVRAARRLGLRSAHAVATVLLCGICAAAPIVAVGLPVLVVLQKSL